MNIAESTKQTFNDLTNLQKQAKMIERLILEKKQVIANYFDKTGERRLDNEEGSIFIQERTKTEFDVHAMLKELPKKLTSQFIDKEYYITDWDGLVNFFKENDIKASEIREFITVKSEVDQEKLSQLYDHKKVKLEQLKPYMNITFTKSLCLKLKPPKDEDDE